MSVNRNDNIHKSKAQEIRWTNKQFSSKAGTLNHGAVTATASSEPMLKVAHHMQYLKEK